jgi:AhpD family alkylhydroperoxidase
LSAAAPTLSRPPSHSRDLAAGIPGAAHVHLPTAWHLLPQEIPKIINAAIRPVIRASTAARAAALASPATATKALRAPEAPAHNTAELDRSHFCESSRLTGMTQKTRIEPLPPKRAGLLTRTMYRVAKRRYGQVPEPLAVVAHHRKLLVASAIHETMVDRASRTLPTSVRELAVLWTARQIGCSWCVDFGSMLQRLDGLDMERLKEIDNYATSPAYTDDERAAIAYANAITTDPHTVTDEQVADLRARFSDAGVIELTYQIGLENMRARVNATLGITEQGFNSGDACRIPWAGETSRTAARR